VVVSPGTGIFRLGSDVTGHGYIWNSATQQWELSKNKIHYQEGWFATEFHQP